VLILARAGARAPGDLEYGDPGQPEVTGVTTSVNLSTERAYITAPAQLSARDAQDFENAAVLRDREQRLLSDKSRSPAGVGGPPVLGASTVVIWELSGTGEERQRRGLRLIGYAFAALAVYLLVQSTVVLAAGYHPRHSVPGIIWTTATAVVMFALAAGKARTGRALDNPVLRTEGRVT
jgi:hypothetical protein